MGETKTSSSCWKDQLNQVLNPKNPAIKGDCKRTALIGAGNEMQADDAAGLLVIRELKLRLTSSPQVLLIEGGMAPENFTGKIRAFKPDLVILIDAAEMGLTPGQIRWVELDEIDGFSASSHILPLSVLAEFLMKDIGGEVRVIGIQVGSVEMGKKVTPEVTKSAVELADAIFMVIKAIDY